jgi:hypothetical protein
MNYKTALKKTNNELKIANCLNRFFVYNLLGIYVRRLINLFNTTENLLKLKNEQNDNNANR